MGTTMHTNEVANKVKAEALKMFERHDHDGHIDELTRENCGACVLAGYDAHDETGSLQPNYAGWERAYVQAGRPIPKKFREAFEDGRVDENHAYAAGLALDIATFGVKYED